MSQTVHALDTGEHSPGRCDNTSVGILITDSSRRLLVFDRATPPWGVAGPAGHVDDHGNPEQAAAAEVLEEVGLHVVSLELLTRRWRGNRCDRLAGPHGVGHEWWIYQARVDGALAPSRRETRNARWLTPGQLQALTVRTLAYAGGRLPESEWWAGPGIEPAWVLWLSLAGLITATREDLAAVDQAGTWQVRA
jgi:8-oxo-dGTP pyrophosphatase MutT (NUDIX family)